MENKLIEKTNGESLYPSTLFHFSSKEGLYGILKSHFRLSYSLETIKSLDLKRSFGVPMVSFCDIKLSELGEHMSKYNKYGLGLTKEWANRKGLNPVLYVSKHSPFTQNYIEAMGEVYPLLSRLKKEHSIRKIYETIDYIEDEVDYDSKRKLDGKKREVNILNSYRYIKNYENDLKRKGTITKDYRFADEREWRYVPQIELPFKHEPFVAESNMRTKAEKGMLNESLKNENLNFEFTDIRYIILEYDKDIQDCIRHIKTLSNNTDVTDKLISCIITAERMNQDV